MNIGKLKNSNFLTKEDVGRGVLVTIKGGEEQNVAMPGAPEVFKFCLFFDEFDKPMVLNWTNAQIIAKAIGSEETEDWIGAQIVLYNDPTVSFAGTVTGGIRARARRKQARPQAPQRAIRSETKPPAEIDSPSEDDVPY